MRHTLLFLLFLLGSFPVFAQNWTGAVDSDWNNPANWSALPANGDTLIIDPLNYTGEMAAPIVSGTSDFTPSMVTVQAGAQLTINGMLDVTDELRITGINSWMYVQGTLTITEGNLVVTDLAAMNLTGGTLEVGDAFILEEGASIAIYTAGTLEAHKVVIDGGADDTSSDLYINSGLVAADTLQFSNETTAFEPRLRLAGGELNIAQNLSWLSAAPDAGRGYFRQTGGVVHMAGTLGNAVESTMNIKLEVTSGVMTEGFFYNSASAVRLAEGDSLLLVGGGWLEDGTVTWENDGVVWSDGWGLYKSGNTTLTGTGHYQFGAVFVSEGRTLNHVSPQDLRINAEFIVNGTFIPNENRVIINSLFSGQLISAQEEGITFYDLVINNSSPTYGTYSGTVKIQPQATIEHSMVLTDGIVVCGPGLLHFPDDATLTGGADTTFIDGEILKTGNDAFTFAVGRRSTSLYEKRYRPLTITAPASVATGVTVGYHFSAPGASSVSAPLESISLIEYWELSRGGSDDLVNVSVAWSNAASSGLSDCDEISLAYREMGTLDWNAVPSVASGLCSGDDAGTLTSTVPLPEYTTLAIGFTANTVHQQAVAVCNGGNYTINGNTYDDSGIYVDEMEAANGDDSTVVTILTVRDPLVASLSFNPETLFASVPAGVEVTYQWIDCDNGNAVIPGETGSVFFPEHPGNYAVIAYSPECDETDTSYCLEMPFVGLEEKAAISMKVYPNPVVSGGQLLLKTSAELAQLEVCALDGRVVVPGTKPETQDNKITLDLPELPAGTYLLTGQAVSGQRSVVRFMVTN